MRYLIAIHMILSTPLGAAKDKVKSDAVDSVLDRLEKRLLDEEAEDLIGKDRSSPPTLSTPKSKGGKPTTTKHSQKFNKEQVRANTQEVKEIQGIGQLVTQLESQIDQFSQSVQKSRQSLIEEAKIDNYIDIEVRLSDPDAAAINMLTVKLDGFSIYQNTDSAGLWLPSAAIPLYSGPFPPGTHRLDLEMRLARKTKSPLLINEDIYHFINKAFDITVPTSKEKKRYIITIAPQTGDGKPFEATLEDEA